MAITPEQQRQFDKIYASQPDSTYVKELQDKMGYTPSSPTTVQPPATTKPPTTTTKDTTIKDTTVKTSEDPVKMWTGTGYATVNPKYVDQYLAKGYTLDLPSDEQVKEFIKNPIETGQVRDPLTGAVSDAPTLATPPATQDTRNIIGYRDGSPILQVTPEGVAPANAQIGDIIRTAGGDYLITGGTVGNWERMKLDGVTQDVTEDAQAPEVTQDVTEDAQAPGVAQEGFVDDFGQFQFSGDETADDFISNMANTQYQMALNAIQSAYDQSLAEVERQKEQIATNFAEGRRAIDVQGAKQAKSLSDYLAARGLSTSGAAAQGAIQQSIAEQEAISGNLSQEQEAYKDLALAQADLNAQYQGEIANAKLDALNKAQAMAYDEYQYQRDVSRQDEQLDFERELDTITQYSNDYQAEINRRMEIDHNDPFIPYLKVARNQKIMEEEERINDAAIAQEKAYQSGNQQVWDNQFDLFVEAKEIVTQEMSEVLGLPMGFRLEDYESGANDTVEPLSFNEALRLFDDFTEQEKERTKQIIVDPHDPSKNIPNPTIIKEKQLNYLDTMVTNGQITPTDYCNIAISNGLKSTCDPSIVAEIISYEPSSVDMGNSSYVGAFMRD